MIDPPVKAKLVEGPNLENIPGMDVIGPNKDLTIPKTNLAIANGLQLNDLPCLE